MNNSDHIDMSNDEDKNSFVNVLNILFDGRAKGNQIDQKAAESLLLSIKYKFCKEFYELCNVHYIDYLRYHNTVIP